MTDTDLTFLALTVWREARGEVAEAKLAVAYSILQRVAHPRWWGNSVQTVVGMKWQYSSLTAPGDPNLIQWPPDDQSISGKSWADCVAAAYAAINHTILNPVPNADSYYDVSIKQVPKWATLDGFIKQVGRLRFHRTIALDTPT